MLEILPASSLNCGSWTIGLCKDLSSISSKIGFKARGDSGGNVISLGSVSLKLNTPWDPFFLRTGGWWG